MKRLLALLLIILASILLLNGVYQLAFQQTRRTIISPISLTSEDVVATINGYPINQDGLVFTAPVASKTPNINVETAKLYGGEQIKGEEILTSLALLQEAQAQQVEVVGITIYNRDYMELQIKDRVVVIYNETSDPYHIIATLKSMLSVFTIETNIPKSIDYRFDKPIIRY